VRQATDCNGCAFDLSALSQDCLSSAEVDISRSEIIDALVIALTAIIGHEGFDLSFQFTGLAVVVKQDPVLECLMPPFDHALGLRMIWGAAYMLHACFIFAPGGCDEPDLLHSSRPKVCLTGPDGEHIKKSIRSMSRFVWIRIL